MPAAVGVRELRQNLSKYLDRVKAGETLSVTERGNEVALLLPTNAGDYLELVIRFGATIPTKSIDEVLAAMPEIAPAPAGTTDALLAEPGSGRVD